MEPQDYFDRKVEKISSELNELKKSSSKDADTVGRQRRIWNLENELRDIPIPAGRI